MKKVQKFLENVIWPIMKIAFWVVTIVTIVTIVVNSLSEYRVKGGKSSSTVNEATFGIDTDPESPHVFSTDRKTLDVLGVKSCEQDPVSGLYRVVSIVIREGKEIDTAAMSNRKFEIGDKVHHVSFVVLPQLETPKHLNSVYFAIPATNGVAVTNR